MPGIRPILHVVAGPNGSGKSTLTRSGRFGGARIVDPDAIARRMAPDAPEGAAGAAGREAIRERRGAIADRETLVVETTLSGHGALRLMDNARAAGYRVVLHYVSVDSVEQTLDRISCRVALGGHDVPEDDVRRRFDRSRANLPAAIMRADESRLYDNTNLDDPYREVAVLTRDARTFAENPPSWVTDMEKRT